MIKKPLLPNSFTLLQSMNPKQPNLTKLLVTMQFFLFIEEPHKENRGDPSQEAPNTKLAQLKAITDSIIQVLNPNISLVENFLINRVWVKLDQIVRESNINRSLTSQKEKQSLITYMSNSKMQTKLGTVSSSQHSIAVLIGRRFSFHYPQLLDSLLMA